MRKKVAKLTEKKKVLTEEARVLEMIAEGEKEYREGKLKSIKSLAELD